MSLSNSSAVSRFFFLEKLPSNEYRLFGKVYPSKPPRFLVLSLGKLTMIGVLMLAASHFFDKYAPDNSVLTTNPFIYHGLMGVLILGGLTFIVLDMLAYQKL